MENVNKEIWQLNLYRSQAMTYIEGEQEGEEEEEEQQHL